MFSKTTYIFFSIILIFCIFNLNAQNSSLTFTEDTTNFPNPERGFAYVIDPPWPTTITWDFCGCTGYNWTKWTDPVSATALKSWRAQGWSVMFVRYHLSEFRNTTLSQAFLDRLNLDFATIRAEGFKIVPHFTYNWPMGGPDAPVNNVLTHLGQLKPIFKNNVDVIAYADLGLIGCWGENHTSCNGLVDGNTPNANSWKIIDSMFSALPAQRMVVIRYPKWKFRYFGNTSEVPTAPLTASEAYTQTKKARWGQEDDCPTCGEFNCGTWVSSTNNPTGIINFLATDNQYVVQSGETGDPEAVGCGGTADEDGDGWIAPHHADCDRIMWMFAKDHWSVISGTYGQNPNNTAYTAWKTQGCYNTIAKSLGYRFKLIDATIPKNVNAGGAFAMSFKVANIGWANPYNPRGFEIVLRNRTTKAEYFINVTTGLNVPADHTQDPRFWTSGITTSVNINKTVPSTIPTGDYDLFFHLYDPETSIKSRPEYAIHLANKNIWEATTGYNALMTSVKVTNSGGKIITVNPSNNGVKNLTYTSKNNISINYDIPKNEVVKIDLYNASGRIVMNILNSQQRAGWLQLNVNTTNLLNGFYFVKMQTNGMNETKKIVIVK